MNLLKLAKREHVYPKRLNHYVGKSTIMPQYHLFSYKCMRNPQVLYNSVKIYLG